MLLGEHIYPSHALTYAGDIIECGTTHCNARTQVCCIGAINTYSCVDGDVCTF